MALNFFGFKIGKDDEDEKAKSKSFAIPQPDDGSFTLQTGGYYGDTLDFEAGLSAIQNEPQLINRYREIALSPEGESAVDDIVNEAIVSDEWEAPVSVVLDDLEQPDTIKDKIKEEFDTVLKLLDFNNNGHEMFRRWYVDGRLYHHLIIDNEHPEKGLLEARYIDPRRIRKVREIKKGVSKVGTPVVEETVEYYVYNEKGLMGGAGQGLKISPDSISYIHSGLVDYKSRLVQSYLHQAIKPLNQLRMIEDAVVIYRLARAPERRIFYIDVGNLPKIKAEQYLKDIMNKYRNKLVYDAQTGEIRDDRKHMTMLEDFWLPRREGGRGTEITTLPGGQNLGEMDDVSYFLRKFYKALHVPVSRLESENNFNIGRAAEITRDELKFSKFVGRLRKRFAGVFNKMLGTQLLLKGVITKDNWNDFQQHIHYDFVKDSHFSELKQSEVMRERLTTLNDLGDNIGKYYSHQWVRKNVLMMSDDEIKQMDQEIEDEKASKADDGGEDDEF